MKQIISFLLLAIFAIGVESCPGHEIEIYNGCPFPVWPAVFSTKNPQTNNGFKLDPYGKRSIQVPCKWEAARIWARTDCDGSGRNCLTGDCGQMVCQGSGQPDVTLAEFTLDGGNNPNFGNDIYDISAVDGFNLPMNIYPVNGAKTGSNNRFDCTLAQCKFDFRNNCHDELKEIKNNHPVACLSACTKKNDDWFCCRGAHNRPETCEARNHPLVRFFKQQCPDMYSFAYDDQASTFSCKGNHGTKYVVSFCPA